MATPGTNRYWTPVDVTAENTSHAFAIDFVGYNKRVLELGPAAGHVTRPLVARGCEVLGIEVDPEAAAGLEGVAECLVGDLNDVSMIGKAAETGLFDVVLAGDVLEHLTDPLATLRACREALLPGGYVVISLPNVAHADVALALLNGQFRYADSGLLDRTHLRFFTNESVEELLRESGFMATDLRRVVRPVFESELGLDRSAFAPEVVESVLAHSEAETYQFVVRAVRHDGDLEVRRLADRAIESTNEARTHRQARVALEAEVTRLRASLAEWEAAYHAANEDAGGLRWALGDLTDQRDRLADLIAAAERAASAATDEASRAREETEAWRAEAEVLRARIDALMRSRTMRYTRAPRRVVGLLRRNPG